jgi:hypothetical protein
VDGLAAATGGSVHAIGASSETIADAILAALSEIEVQVLMRSDCATATGGVITTTFSPNPQTATGGEDVVFTETKTIKVPEGFLTGGGNITNGKGPNAERISWGGDVGFLADFSIVGEWNTNFHNVDGTSLDGPTSTPTRSPASSSPTTAVPGRARRLRTRTSLGSSRAAA